MPRWVLWVVAVIGMMAVTAFGAVQERAATYWEARAGAALAAASASAPVIDSLKGAAEAHERRAEEMAALADERGRQVRERVVEVRTLAVPDTCAPFVEPRDAIIDSLMIESGRNRTAYEWEREATVAARSALSVSLVRGDSLVAVLEDRPSRHWWVPQTGIGVFTGVCAGGQSCTGVGVTLSWRIW